jgi:hypothetical protein
LNSMAASEFIWLLSQARGCARSAWSLSAATP